MKSVFNEVRMKVWDYVNAQIHVQVNKTNNDFVFKEIWRKVSERSLVQVRDKVIDQIKEDPLQKSATIKL